jgi:hypothetical protein
MNAETLKARFARIGARLQVGEGSTGARERARGPLTLDVRSDAGGEFFDIRLRPRADVDLEVIDSRRRDQHLLLQARVNGGRHLYLCGHDERHWFVAGVPDRTETVTHVHGAMEALKPEEVLDAQRRQGVKGKDRLRRKNAAYVRQGEWFFVPAPKARVEKQLVLFNEPLSRGNGSKPHMAEFLYRKGGETVYVCNERPQGLPTHEYRRLLNSRPRARAWNWRTMVRNPEAYVKGKVSHPDHETIDLYVWHRVFMNTEGESQAMRHVVFLD